MIEVISQNYPFLRTNYVVFKIYAQKKINCNLGDTLDERELELSIVIRCCNDWGVLKCINSIDEYVEIIVSMCENKDLQEAIGEIEKEIRCVVVPKGNLSITSNMGMENTRYQKVIDTDSDTIFKPGTIREVYYLLDNYEAVKLQITFSYRKKRSFSYIVAATRNYVNSQHLFFTPGIAYKKSLIPKIGNKLFNIQVPFAVDAELNHRIHENGIKFIHTKGGIIHKEEKMKHDLKSAYRIGKGCRIGKLQLQITNLPLIPLKVVRFRDYYDIVRKLGFKVIVYQIIWDLFFYSGYFIQSLHSRNHKIS